MSQPPDLRASPGFQDGMTDGDTGNKQRYKVYVSKLFIPKSKEEEKYARDYINGYDFGYGERLIKKVVPFVLLIFVTLFWVLMISVVSIVH